MSINVLLVEDDQPTAHLFGYALREIGTPVEVYHIPDSDEAIEFLRLGNRVDVVVTDINLPRGSGFDVLTEAGDARRVVFTTSQRPEDQRMADLFGAEFIRKPSNLDGFIAAVERICCATSAAVA